MSNIFQPTPVKFFAAVLFNNEELLEALKSKLENVIGEIDYISPSFPFEATTYYESEMGKGLKRLFYSFRNLLPPDEIVEIKLKTSRVEDQFSTSGKRNVNIDPGYMDYFKIILASFKFGGQKIYLGKGVYGDMTLWYEKGKFKPFSWGFPDFQSGLYNEVLLKLRQRYKSSLRNCIRDPQ